MSGKNNIKIYDDYAELIIESPTHGKFIAIIDLEDVERCNEIKWSINKFKSYRDNYYTFYIVSKEALLHRFIMNAPEDKDVDHIDGNTMNNRKKNLRPCTRQQNSMNRKMSVKNKSGHKGVIWHKTTGKWMAYIMINYKHKTLGYFNNIEDAVRVRKQAENEYFGEFSREIK